MHRRALGLSIGMLCLGVVAPLIADCPGPGWTPFTFTLFSAPPWTQTIQVASTEPETWIIGTSDNSVWPDEIVDVYLDNQLVGQHDTTSGGQTMLHEAPGCVAPGSHEIKLVLVQTSALFGSDWCYSLDRSPCSATTSVEIDVKPGTDANPISLESRGLVPVAVLTTADFDALTIDPGTVGLGPGGAAAMRWSAEDVDGDGDVDLLLKFRTQEIGLTESDTEVTLAGLTKDAQPIEGTDSVSIVPG